MESVITLNARLKQLMSCERFCILLSFVNDCKAMVEWDVFSFADLGQRSNLDR